MTSRAWIRATIPASGTATARNFLGPHPSGADDRAQRLTADVLLGDRPALFPAPEAQRPGHPVDLAEVFEDRVFALEPQQLVPGGARVAQGLEHHRRAGLGFSGAKDEGALAPEHLLGAGVIDQLIRHAVPLDGARPNPSHSPALPNCGEANLPTE